MTAIIPNTFGAEIGEVIGVQANAGNIPMKNLEISNQKDKEKQVKGFQENAKNIYKEDNNSSLSQKPSAQKEEVYVYKNQSCFVLHKYYSQKLIDFKNKDY